MTQSDNLKKIETTVHIRPLQCNCKNWNLNRIIQILNTNPIAIYSFLQRIKVSQHTYNTEQKLILLLTAGICSAFIKLLLIRNAITLNMCWNINLRSTQTFLNLLFEFNILTYLVLFFSKYMRNKQFVKFFYFSKSLVVNIFMNICNSANFLYFFDHS